MSTSTNSSPVLKKFLDTIRANFHLFDEGLQRYDGQFKEQCRYIFQRLDASNSIASSQDEGDTEGSSMVAIASTSVLNLDTTTTSDTSGSSSTVRPRLATQAPTVAVPKWAVGGESGGESDLIQKNEEYWSSSTDDESRSSRADVASSDSGSEDSESETEDTAPDLEGDISVALDVSKVDKATTLHDFLLAPHLLGPLPTVLRSSPSPRSARNVEILDTKLRLLEIVYMPNMGRVLHNFLSQNPSENLENIEVPSALLRILLAGAHIANCALKLWSEADVEFRFRVVQGHVVAECLNHREGYPEGDERRYYPRKGIPGTKAGQMSHAVADVELGRTVTEIKTVHSIDADFISNFLGMPLYQFEDMINLHGTDRGYRFDFSPPQTLADTVGPYAQPVVQVWTQFHEKSYRFGLGSSQEYNFFTIKDPATPQRLYISACFPTFAVPRSVQVSEPEGELTTAPSGSKEPKPFHTSDSESLADPNLGPDSSDEPEELEPYNSGLYTMYNLCRIANKPELEEQFFQELRETARNLIPVRYLDFNRIGEMDPPATGIQQQPNMLQGTVGVKYFDQPNTVGPKPRKLRARKKPEKERYTDPYASSRSEIQVESGPSTPEKAQQVKAKPQKPAKSQKGKGKAR
ncbi:hypothetical protein B0H15DRAFT_954483 [Mycena belliarum]|uniref:Uncharacterized protein n=1 Tax=Mycena belliarum TaxID=1033014 RepID=A0AAD6TSX9_9AGAR|nr:hypothetical protein B0H15DRAFT_954483 [Mycena belliae]